MSNDSGPASQLAPDWSTIHHSSAIVSLTISIIFSFATTVYLLRNKKQSLWQCKISERLVVYLAIGDLVYSFSHIFDHIIFMVTGEYAPAPFCELLAFFLATFCSGPIMIVGFTALNAFCQVVLNKPVNIGKYDWRLLLPTLTFPAVAAAIWWAVGGLGPDVAWCGAKMEPGSLNYFNIFYASGFFGILLHCIVCYSAVAYKINRSATHLSKSSQAGSSPNRGSSGDDGIGMAAAVAAAAAAKTHKRNTRVALIMSVFVIFYVIQWSPYIIWSMWSFFGEPRPVTVTITLISGNCGGFFNCMAYTVIRRYNMKQN